MKLPLARLLLAGLSTLAACNGTPSPPSTRPDSSASLAPAATAAADTARPVSRANGNVPFVPPTKIGRLLGDPSPSPPASRTR